MTNISQNTVVAMINLFEHLGCYDSPMYTYGLDGPLVSATELRTFLYSLNFDNQLLNRFEREDWKFNSILPTLRDGTFWKVTSRRLLEDAEAASAKVARGETVLRQLAEALVELCRRQELLHSWPYMRFVSALRNDGFTLSFGKIIESGTEVVDLPAELSATEKTVTNSKHDAIKTLLHHLQSAQKQMMDSAWGTASGEWRKFFEETIRGVWRLTRLNNPDFATRDVHPPFKDVLLWLEQAGLFTSDEKAAYGAAWGFLSVGGHPGMTEGDIAHFCMILSMTFSHAALKRLDWWANKGYFIFGTGPFIE